MYVTCMVLTVGQWILTPSYDTKVHNTLPMLAMYESKT